MIEFDIHNPAETTMNCRQPDGTYYRGGPERKRIVRLWAVLTYHECTDVHSVTLAACTKVLCAPYMHGFLKCSVVP